MKVRLPGLLGLLCCTALAGGPVLADNGNVDADPSASTVPEISLWVRDAPMSLVVKQLAQLSGREVVLDGALDMSVSGRFGGSLEQTLVELSANHPVLFDLDGRTLRATGSDNSSKVSIAVVSDELSEEFKSSLFEQLAPGNDIEIRADAVRVAGHPVFVKRVSGLITRTLADNGARQGIEPDVEPTMEAAVAGIDSTANSVDQKASEVVIDVGSDEMLADIADEGKPAADQATLSKPIRWVTDIPGYDTF
ncbi:hypothetical protein ACUNV4_18610 [Granulosicoccus sp. 3-233]|uniref:hypothetical protein n=1 Tax=Granulosicoccus sp. 3-233 TaxID=3417969 RepID=UPI003D353BD3